ncbi:MAG: glycosyltransferase family 4 protein [Elsteraceae bacterium]
MTVAFVVKGYPRLSETFVAQEIHGLERRGIDIALYSLRHPTDKTAHPLIQEIRAPVDYLPEYLHDAPGQVLAAWTRQRRRPGYPAARAAWLRDLARDRTRNRVRRFGQALVLADRLPPSVTHLHAHFIHTPASVARYAATILGLPWTASAHARDIWTSPDWELSEKLADCRWAVTCTRIGRDHLASLSPRPDSVHLAYHGLDLGRFPPVDRAPPGDDSSLRLLSVCRLVEKKGVDDLIDALARLPASIDWRLTHIGGGPLKEAMAARAAAHGIAGRIEWRGAQAQGAVLAAYRAADLFVLASRIAGDGDRDGLPNVLMEAQSQGVACVATAVSAIPELIAPDTGVLVRPADPVALADAIQALAEDPERRRALGEAGQRRVRTHFSADGGLDWLAERFRGL